MKRSLFLLSIAVMLVAVGVAWAYSNWRAYAPTTYVQEMTDTTTGAITSVTVNTKTGTTTPGAPSITLAQIATHNSASSCYSAINGKVYDLTLWINMHPGGKGRILSICGIDGSSAFNAQHGGQQKPLSILARFYIGTLK